MTTYLRTIVVGLAWSLIGFSGLASLPGTGSVLAAAAEESVKDTVRPEVGKPLKAAQDLTTAKKYQEAMAKLDEADAITDKTPFESFVIARMRGTTAISLGNLELAAKSFTAAMAFNRLKADELLDISRVMAGQFYNKKDYVNAGQWASLYFEKGGKDAQVKVLLAQSYFLRNDFAKAASLLQELSQADEAAGRVTAESQLQLLANCQYKEKNNVGMVATLEKLVIHYPKKDYWNDLIHRAQRNPEFVERLALDAYRLQIYAGNLGSAEEYMEMAALAMQAGFPMEAKKVLDQGYADKLLGTGPDEANHKKLLDAVNKGAAEDQKALAQDEKRAAAAKTGTTPVNTGFNYVLSGQFEKGIALIERGIALGGLKFPEDAKLKLAMSYHYAGNKEKALQAFKAVTGTDGTAVLARYWVLRINQG